MRDWSAVSCAASRFCLLCLETKGNDEEVRKIGLLSAVQPAVPMACSRAGFTPAQGRGLGEAELRSREARLGEAELRSREARDRFLSSRMAEGILQRFQEFRRRRRFLLASDQRCRQYVSHRFPVAEHR